MIKSKKYWLHIMIGFCLALTGTFLFTGEAKASAISPVQIQEVNYDDESITIQNNGNSRILYETDTEAAKGNWETIDADLNPDGSLASTTTIDISWLSPAAENILKIKGNKDVTQARVIISERIQKFDISIGYTNINNLNKTNDISTLLNIMTTAGNAFDPITYDDLEWRKGESGKWKNISTLTVGQLEKFQVMGTNLYFRIRAINDLWNGSVSADGTEGRRPSNEVKLKINKKSTPMVVGIDGEEFTADIKYGKEYRVTYDANDDGKFTETPTSWIKITDRATKFITLSDILKGAAYGTTEDKVFKAIFLEIRDYSTSKTAASKITEIILNKQRIIDGTATQGTVPENEVPANENIYYSYTGNKYINITIPSATSVLPYEYCVVKPTDVFDLSRAVWTSITKSTEVKILASKAVDGGTLYIRQKEIRSQEATKTNSAIAYALASTYETIKIDYPSIPVLEKQNLVFTKGYSGSITFTVKLNIENKKPFETKLKNIKLGTREIESSYTVGTDPTNAKIQIMTITLKDTSLKLLTNCYNRALTITFENGTVDKTSVKLTIQNPTPAPKLTTSSVPGSTIGTLKLSVVSTIGTGNKWVYEISDAEVKNKNNQDTFTTGTTFEAGKDITVAAGKYLTIYELTSTNYIVKYNSILISSVMLNPGP